LGEEKTGGFLFAEEKRVRKKFVPFQLEGYHQAWWALPGEIRVLQEILTLFLPSSLNNLHPLP
jgi:hypothetical protein